MKACSGSDKLKEFRKVYTQMTSRNTTMKIAKCLKPNCKTYAWKKTYEDSFAWPYNKTQMWFGLAHNTYTIRRTEILLADFSTFMADCGSFLGLYLGASVLSMTDILILYAKKMVKVVVRKFRNLPKNLEASESKDGTDLNVFVKNLSERVKRLEDKI